MSEDERISFTDARVKQLEENREIRDLGKHTAEASAFRDAQATFERVENEVTSTYFLSVDYSTHWASA